MMYTGFGLTFSSMGSLDTTRYVASNSSLMVEMGGMVPGFHLWCQRQWVACFSCLVLLPAAYVCVGTVSVVTSRILMKLYLSVLSTSRATLTSCSLSRDPAQTLPLGLRMSSGDGGVLHDKLRGLVTMCALLWLTSDFIIDVMSHRRTVPFGCFCSLLACLRLMLV